MATYTTKQGDTWDIIAKSIYDDELQMTTLISANIDYRKIVIFPAGITLNVPAPEATESESNLPIWKRS